MPIARIILVNRFNSFFIYSDPLTMIGLPPQNGSRPIKLLNEHEAKQLMGKSKGRKGKAKIRPVQDLRTKT